MCLRIIWLIPVIAALKEDEVGLSQGQEFERETLSTSSPSKKNNFISKTFSFYLLIFYLFMRGYQEVFKIKQKIQTRNLYFTVIMFFDSSKCTAPQMTCPY